jgi:hypothetical protein
MMHDIVKTACITMAHVTDIDAPAPFVNRFPVQATANANTWRKKNITM